MSLLRLLMPSSCVAVIAISLAPFLCRPAETEPLVQEPDVKQLRLHVVGPGELEQAIVARPGEVIQLTPFTYPLVGGTLGAELQVELAGERAVEVIGQINAGELMEGRAGKSIFLHARTEGRVTVVLKLVDGKSEHLDGYMRTYTIEVEQPQQLKSEQASSASPD